MRKVWNTLVVLGVLLCMIMSLGVAADAAEGDAAVFAVSGVQLAPESIGLMQTECPQCLVVDVDGLDDGQSAMGYNVVYAPSDPVTMSDYAYIWPGFAQQFEVGAEGRKVVLVGVGEASTSEEISAAVSAYLPDEPYVIAVGPAAAAAAVGGCADVDMFMTSGLDDDGAAQAAADAGSAKLVNVGKEEAPVSLVKVNADGTASAENIPVPQPVADPGVGPVEQESESVAGDEPAADGVAAPEGEDNGEAVSDGLAVAPGPVIDVPEVEDAPETVIYYAVKYDGNGRDEGTYVNDDLQVAGGSEYALRDNGYTRAGYNFVGWTLDVPDAETVYQPGDKIIVNGNTTVYAKWAAIEEPAADEPVADEPVADEPVADEPVVDEPVADEPVVDDAANGEPVVAETQLTVTYKAGESAEGDKSFPCDNGAEITLRDVSTYFTAPEGKKFSGWLLEGTDELYEVGASYTVTGNVTFVAQYRDNAVYTVTYDLSGSGNDSYSVTVVEGDPLTLDPAPAVAPENMAFGGWLVNGELRAAGEAITVSGDVTVTAQWNVAEPEVVAEISVTYKSGIEGVEDVTVTTPANVIFNLPVCSFDAPEGQNFLGWAQEGGDGTVLAVGAEVTAGTADMAFVAQWESMISATVTYLPDNGSNVTLPEQTDSFKSGESVMYSLKQLPEQFTVPAGKTFGGWKIGDSTYQPGDTITVSGDTTVTAIWNDVAKEKVDPAVDTDSLMYTQGATDDLQVQFKAEIDTVSVDNAALTLNSQYGVVTENGVSTITFDNAYLDGLSVGDHTLNVTFVATDTTEYTPNTRTLTIKEAPVEETAAPTQTPTNEVNSIQQDWDRSTNLILDFASYKRGNPVKLELLRAYEKDDSGNYKKDENGNYIPVWKELTNGQDFTVNGTSMTIYPSLLGSWANNQYGFRVTFDGAGTDKGTNTMLLYLKVTGEAPKQAQPTATATAAPAATGSAGYVTGDGVNLRAGAGMDSQVLRTVAKGTKITIFGIANGWASVSVDGVNGYMSANYVAYENTAPTATPAGAASPATGDTNNVVLYIVILVVLIIALAAVLIIVVKRRNR